MFVIEFMSMYFIDWENVVYIFDLIADKKVLTTYGISLRISNFTHIVHCEILMVVYFWPNNENNSTNYSLPELTESTHPLHKSAIKIWHWLHSEEHPLIYDYNIPLLCNVELKFWFIWNLEPNGSLQHRSIIQTYQLSTLWDQLQSSLKDFLRRLFSPSMQKDN